MDEHNVYHYHHHHYHYHYTYPFPPGLPPNGPQNSEPLNQEAAGYGNDEPSAEDEENEEERSERGGPEDQQRPEDRSPTPVPEETTSTEVERIGLVVFDDSFDILNLDALSPEAQARFTNAQLNNDDHEEGPQRKKARTSFRREQLNAQAESYPRQSGNITVIDNARFVCTASSHRVVNCDPSGPQINICWRVPGRRNIRLARISISTLDQSLAEVLSLHQAEGPGDQPLLNALAAKDNEGTVSLIIGSCGAHDYNCFERGGGVAIPTGPEMISTLGRLVGFEVLEG